MENILFLSIFGGTKDSRSNTWTSFNLTDISLLCSSQDPASLFKINQDPYTPTKGDKFYFLEKVNVPRVKLKDFHDEHGTKTIRDVSQATHVFVGERTIDLYTEKRWVYEIPVALIKKFFELHVQNFDAKAIEDVRQMFEFYTEDKVYLNYQGANLLEDNSIPFYKELTQEPSYEKLNKVNSVTVYSILDEYLPIYNQVKDIVLIDESCLLSVINGTNAAVIDEEMFGRLAAMFNSNDTDNHILAMEIMANSQYEKSLYYLEILFKEYNGIMYNLPSKRHVNFKSLTIYLEKNSYFGTSLDGIVQSLVKKEVLTHFMLTDLMHRYKDEIIRNGESKYFAIKNITVTQELHEFINQDFTYNLVADYEPTVEEVEIPEDFLTYNPTDEEATFTQLSEEPIDKIEEVVEEELPGTEIELVEEVFEEEIIVEPKKEEDESEIDWF